MFRILTPNGQWIMENPAPNGLKFESLGAAMEFAHRYARITEDHGEFLIYEGDRDTPSASARMYDLFEDDNA